MIVTSCEGRVLRYFGYLVVLFMLGGYGMKMGWWCDVLFSFLFAHCGHAVSLVVILVFNQLLVPLWGWVMLPGFYPSLVYCGCDIL